MARRPLAVLILALSLLGGLAIVAGIPPATAADDPSSRSPGRDGTLALHTWLADLGFQVHRLGSDFDLSGTDVLVSSDPRDRFTPAEAQAVLAHVSGGGDAVIALSGPAGVAPVQVLLDSLHISVAGETGPGTATPAQPIDAGGRVDRVGLGPSAVLAGGPEVVPLLTLRGATVAAAVRLSHGGRLYFIGSSKPFSNDGLRREDASSLVLTLMERARGGRIALDEFHHGEGRAQTGAAAILLGPVGLAALLGTALLVAALAMGGRRLGRPVPSSNPSRVPTAVTYVEAMANLYRRSARRGGVADRYAEELKSRIAGVTGVDMHLGDDSFIAALAGITTGIQLNGTAELLARARALAASDPSDAELLALAREVDAAEQRWSPQPAYGG